MKKFLKRTGMVILFLGAFYTTVTSISNVTLADIKAASQEKEHNLETSGHLLEGRETALTEKVLNYNQEEKQYISSEQIDGPETLEEAVNMEQYTSDTVIATGYTSGLESNGNNVDHAGYGITFSGVQVKSDLYSTIAADLSVYQIGTVLYMPDYGYGVVADKGSAITGNK